MALVSRHVRAILSMADARYRLQQAQLTCGCAHIQLPVLDGEKGGGWTDF